MFVWKKWVSDLWGRPGDINIWLDADGIFMIDMIGHSFHRKMLGQAKNFSEIAIDFRGVEL